MTSQKKNQYVIFCDIPDCNWDMSAGKAASSRMNLMEGFIDGLSAPSFFITGELETLAKPEISTLRNNWENVGRAIRSSAERYRGRREKSA